MGSFITQGEYYSDSSETDVEYKRFLDNLKEDGSSYVFQSSSTFVKYEAEPQTSIIPLLCDSSKTETEYQKQNKARGDRTKALGICVKFEEVNENFLNEFKELRGQFTTKRKGRDIVSSLKLGKTNIESCYELFLSRVQFWVDGSFLLESDDGMPVVYGQRPMFPPETTCALDGDSVSSDSSADVLESREVATESGRHSKKASFRTRLESSSDRLFDQEEYQSLLREVSTRTPLKRDRQLRGIIKTYDADEMGRSYFDHYPDFSEKVKTACCDAHRFKQLLGFFFWLENLCHDGSFKPWSDARFTLCRCCR